MLPPPRDCGIIAPSISRVNGSIAMRIALGADHGGFELRDYLKEALKPVEAVCYGAEGPEAYDYPDAAIAVAEEVASGKAEFGVLVCRSGIGMCMAANRFSGVRAAVVTDLKAAAMTRLHNGANVICLGADWVSKEDAFAFVRKFISTEVDMADRHERRRRKIDRAGRVGEVSTVAREDPEVYAAIKAQAQQEDLKINLIASENYASRAVREASGSILTNKYAEGYPGKRWYCGCEPVDSMEEIAIRRACELFGAEHANVQPHCGSSANLIVYQAAIKPGDTIMALSLDQGGHLSHGSPINSSGKLYRIVPYHVERESGTIDYDALEMQALEVKPQILLSGASAYPRAIDFRRIRSIVDKVTAAMRADDPASQGCLMMVDMAHIAGLVAGGAHESPVPYADFVTTTTHKTLRGPRGGLILCKAEWAKRIDSAVFPGMQGGPLENIVAAKAICFKEAMTPAFREYAAQIVSNCKAMCETVKSRGYRIVSGGTDNHLFLIDIKSSKGVTGKDAAAALEAAGIVANKNAIPYDSENPFRTSGVRIGTASVTTRGMKEDECRMIGTWIADILDDISNVGTQSRVREAVRELAARFPVP